MLLTLYRASPLIAGAWSLLLAMLQLEREGVLESTKDQLAAVAQPFCRTSMLPVRQSSTAVLFVAASHDPRSCVHRKGRTLPGAG